MGYSLKTWIPCGYLPTQNVLWSHKNLAPWHLLPTCRGEILPSNSCLLTFFVFLFSRISYLYIIIFHSHLKYIQTQKSMVLTNPTFWNVSTCFGGEWFFRECLIPVGCVLLSNKYQTEWKTYGPEFSLVLFRVFFTGTYFVKDLIDSCIMKYYKFSL